MTDITAQKVKIQTEEVDYRSPVSEGTMTRIGSSINWIIENSTEKVGDIKASMLTESQFQSQRTTKWVLMDGRNVSGSDYSVLTGNSTIPDARATVLRMKDNARSLDPAGDPALGSYQADQFAAHRHFVANSANSGTNNAITSGNSLSTKVYNSEFDTYADNIFGVSLEPNVGRSESVGGSETRVKSVIVNYFIKIND
jgi:hypothetical protein